MDFELTPDQAILQEAVRRQLEERFPMDAVRACQASDGVDRARWRELGKAGVFSLRLDESDGGAGLGMAEAVLVFEELGRALVPGPLVASHLAAGVLPGAAEGTRVVGLVEHTTGPLLVEHLDALDALVVLGDDGARMLVPEGLEAERLRDPLDPLSPMHLLRVVPGGELVGGADVVEQWRAHGTALVAALQLGISEAVLDSAVAYAKERVQFDRPIGAFQAVKHLLADMLVRSEMARAAVYAAGVVFDDPSVGDASRAAHGAKLLAGEAALANAKASIQVLGGMGFTWEIDAHLYLKRAWVLDTVFGSCEAHAEALAGSM